MHQILKLSLLLLIGFLQHPVSVFSTPSTWSCAQQTIEDKIREAERTRNKTSLATLSKEAYTNSFYSPSLLHWNYNALMSVAENGILFTSNNQDSWPAIVLQNALKVRPDILVIPTQLLQFQDYRNLVAQENGLSFITKSTDAQQFIDEILRQKTIGNALEQPVYFGIMTPLLDFKLDQNKLFISGLALRFGDQTPFDQLRAIQNNIEEKFQIDYLKFNAIPEKDPEISRQLNLNYLPALILLHRLYINVGDLENAKKWETLALKIAVEGQKEAELRTILNQTNAHKGPIVSGLTIKSLEKPMKKITATLLASESELSNAQYEAFLQDLIKNKDFDQLNLCKTTKTDWRNLLPENLRNLPDAVIFKHAHPDNPNAPVQNISHEAALKYCEWITAVYNSSKEKKKYKKVKFRLPTKEEWKVAAAGNIKEAVYPWGGQFVRNSKGCYLGNFDATEPCENCPDQINSGYDGGYFPVNTNSYYPNNFGLYNMAGNVAEMVAEPGKAKGGSWRHAPYLSAIAAELDYNAPSPAIGFRVFMEIIEE